MVTGQTVERGVVAPGMVGLTVMGIAAGGGEGDMLFLGSNTGMVAMVLTPDVIAWLMTQLIRRGAAFNINLAGFSLEQRKQLTAALAELDRRERRRA